MRQGLVQGDLDGLCGVYAIINALRRLHRAFDDDAAQALFGRLVRRLAREPGFPAHIWGGINTAQLLRMLIAARRFMAHRFGLVMDWSRPIQVGRLTEAEVIAATLADMLASYRKAVLVLSADFRTPHWTVADRVAGRTLRLSDSGARRRLVISVSRLRRGKRTNGDAKPMDAILITLATGPYGKAGPPPRRRRADRHSRRRE